MRWALGRCIAAVAAMCAGAGAAAGPMLRIDLSGMTIAAGQSFHAAYTGPMIMNRDRSSSLDAIGINGANRSLGAGWELADFRGSLTIVNGLITAGSFEIRVTDSDVVNTYSATLVGGAPLIKGGPGRGFTTGGLTFEGVFSGNTFAGINISDRRGKSKAMRSLFNFKFAPGGRGLDRQGDVDIDIVPTVSAPLPTGAGLGLAGLAATAGFASLVRRRW